MRNFNLRKCLITFCLFAGSLSATPAFAKWYINQSEGFYRAQEYHNENYGDFAPADINERLLGHLAADTYPETDIPDNRNTPATPKQPLATTATTVTPATDSSRPIQNQQAPTNNNYNPARRYVPQGNHQNNHYTGGNGSWNNSRRNDDRLNKAQWHNQSQNNYQRYNKPRNNTQVNSAQGNNVSGNSRRGNVNTSWIDQSRNNQSRNNQSANFRPPWNNRQSNFSGPWNNNSNFGMPWGNNNRNGNGWSWGW